MNFKKQETATKLRGGYYTPYEVSKFLATWILTSNPRSILEPSCGDGAFIRAFQGLDHNAIDFLGIEILHEEVEKAHFHLSNHNYLKGEVINVDFLEWAAFQLERGRTFDAVVGNPPYIRYQYLEKRDQEYSERIFKRFQLPFTKHTNAWVPFVIASVAMLVPGGRLAMVIPSEILHVLHAGSLRTFLLNQCVRILMIDPNELLFAEALQGTVLLMVEKKNDRAEISQGVAILSAPNNSFLNQNPEHFFETAEYVAGEVLNGKWMKVLLDPQEIEVFERIKSYPRIKKFGDIASVDVGIVTGANKFFLVDKGIVENYSLQNFCTPMFGRSEHCKGVVYNNRVHQLNEEKGYPTNFINFGKTAFNELPKLAQKYLKLGEELEYPTRYKCRIRSPWYAVPSVYSTTIGMLKRSHNFPRLIYNELEAFTTDTAYRIRTIEKNLSAPKLVYSFVNSLTALTAELEGRHYGGGVLELVPSEIEKLLVPIPERLKFKIKDLDRLVKASVDVDLLLQTQDKKVLRQAGLSSEEISIIHNAWRRIRIRRQRLVVEPEILNDQSQ